MRKLYHPMICMTRQGYHGRTHSTEGSMYAALYNLTRLRCEIYVVTA